MLHIANVLFSPLDVYTVKGLVLCAAAISIRAAHGDADQS